jgi:hypothetical protein
MLLHGTGMDSSVSTRPGAGPRPDRPDRTETARRTPPRQRVDRAAGAGLALSVEAHTGSLVDTPDKAAQLLDAVPGLTLTLDYAHFVHGGTAQEFIDPPLGRARHLQCRPGRPGGLQVRVAEDAIDWARVVAGLAPDHPGCLALEYTWQGWLDCNRVDTVGESALLRDVLLAADRATTAAGANATTTANASNTAAGAR